MQITLNLLRPEMELDRGLLREHIRFREIDVHPPDADGVTWRLFVRSKPARQASWTHNVTPIVVDPSGLTRLKSQSSAGVLLVGLQDRVFAVTFGMGHHALEPATVEPGFGLKVTANVVAQDRVTSANTKGFNRTGRSQKTVLPAASAFVDLGVEPAEEWIRRLGGRVGDPDFAASAEGADSLKLNIKEFSLCKLPEKLQQIFAHYQSVAYRETFPFLDNFVRVSKGEPLVKKLDAAVAELVRQRDSSLAFAAPDPFDQVAIHH
ncbi:TIGR04141 family sporadically distributed protein [Amycolatopsis sp. CM201R]|nr:TIGR04141 family sporadically distributed protein [Amycolatopsis sp. 505]MDS0145874.1 TIGR04141 family sporadically distributed protein [Amycolatopsis sp. CM201R]